MKRSTVRENVEFILEKYPRTRSNDKRLLLAYWSLVDNVSIADGINIEDFIGKATPPESITRARRLIQESNSELASKEVVKNRKKREQGMKEAVRAYEVV